MPKVKDAKRNQVPAQPLPEAEIVPDGDYRGLPTSDVVRALADGFHSLCAGEPTDAFANGHGVDLPTAGCALDLTLGEYLAIVRGSLGDHNAKVAALAFAETILPYATLAVPVATSYSEARAKIRGHRK